MGEIAINPTHNVFKKYKSVIYVNPYLMTPPVVANTFIGGVSATINTKSLLATKLNISESDIGYFAIVGSDVEVNINVNYSIPDIAFNIAPITFFNDQQGKVTSLGYSCFSDRDLLTTINFPSVTNIGNSAFQNCTTLGGNLVFNELLTLGLSSFQNTKITGFNAQKITVINNATFTNSNFLSSVQTPLVNSIGTYVFQNCTALNNVNFPLITSLGDFGFDACTSLTSSLVFNELLTLGTSVFRNTKITGFNAPKTTTVGTTAFQNCSFLSTININSVTTVGNSAFQNCTTLGGSLVLNGLLTSGSSSFRNTRITGFSAPKLTTSPFAMFNNCTALLTLSLPLVKNIGDYCFDSCSAINSISIPTVTTMGTSNTASNFVFNLIKTSCSITVPIGMQTINAGAVEPDLLYAQNTRGATIIYV